MSSTRVIEAPLLYVVLCIALAVTPGPDVALVIRAATVRGARGAIPVTTGIMCGLLVHISCSILGVSAIIAASDAALTALRIGGALWIGWIAIGTLRDALPRRTDVPTEHTDLASPGWRTGFVTNVLNAKILLFYLAFLPQFAPTDRDFAASAVVLAAIQAAVGVAWLFTCANIAGRLRHLLQPDSRSRRVLDVVTGGILLLAAIELLWSSIP